MFFFLASKPMWQQKKPRGVTKEMSSSSQVFSPFRAIGFCCNHLPLVSSSLGAETFVVTSVGRAFHVYTCDKLRLVFVGTQQPDQLQCLAIQGKIVYASYQNVVKAFKRGQEVNTYLGHEGEVQFILPFGEHLISIDDSNVMRIWHSVSKELYGEMHFDVCSFTILSALHPSTYLNKLLLGSQQGQLQLWNIRTSKLVYTFKGWGSAVQILAQSPAVDVVGVGLESGGIVMHNLKYDQTVMRFHQEWGPVTAMSFRTDGTNTVATGSSIGHIAVWDLDKKRLSTILRNSHNGSVSGLQFLQSQPVMVTSGPDNSLKMWIFDQSDGSARLLRSRCGHSAPPTKIRFTSTGGDAVKILSGGLDNALRVFGVHKDVAMNMELSQGSLLKRSKVRGVKVETLKLPAVADFAAESVRADEWDGVVTCHAGHGSIQTWNLNKYTIGQHTLSSKHADLGAKPKATVDPLEVLPWTPSTWRCSQAPVMEPSSCMLAVAADNFTVSIVDTGGRKVVRRFRGHTNRITDMSFSPDGRWLVTSSMDCSVRTWDLPTGRMIDIFLVESPATSIALSPSGDFLATTHVDDLGIYLWSNKTMYSHVSLRPLSEKIKPTFTDLPTTKLTEHDETDVESNTQRNENELTMDDVSEKCTPLAEGLVTLSMLPKSRWSNLQNLDIIKQRNKPMEPAKTLKLAPFFLPTLPGLQPKFLPSEEGSDIPVTEVGGGSKILNLGELNPLSEFQKCLQQCAGSNQYAPLMDLMKELPPASIDAEFRSLAPESGGSVEWVEHLMTFLLETVRTNRDFELVQSYIGLFLKLHSSLIRESPDLLTLTEKLLSEHKQAWTSLQHDLNMSACLLAYCKSAVI
ncbi:WD repeat-containing protein 36-like isoform X4 [Halichondria panicea]|uniref:WD repeat-containing protein 36-like isoform X4 n=1 Tax=Halichondria panicea TaxID=6063 RepID=UPI00312B7A83